MQHGHLERPYEPEPGSGSARAERAWRQQALLLLAVAGVVVALFAWYWGSTHRTADAFEPPTLDAPVAASAAQRETFATLIHEAYVAVIDARRSGDTSALAGYYADDPTVDRWPECATLLEDHRDEVTRRLGHEPGNGLLTCQVASVVSAWEYAVARATASQLTPPADDGMTPRAWMLRQNPVGALEVRVEEAHVSGDGEHAIVTWVSQHDARMHAALRLVDGRWFVVAEWNDCRKDGPCG